MKKIMVFALLVMVLAGCRGSEKVDNVAGVLSPGTGPDPSPTPLQPIPTTPPATTPETPPTATFVEPKMGVVEPSTLDFELSTLKPATELDAKLTSSGSEANANFFLEFALNFNFGVGNYCDSGYDDYDDYYGDYGYGYDSFQYEESYVEEYETVFYYREEYYHTSFFSHYENYQFRSSSVVWASYPWPSGYGFVACYAQNMNGGLFYGYGFPASFANAAAMATCEANSFTACIPLGCR